MVTTVVQDKFDGAAGSIISHMPDIGSAWGTISAYGWPLDLTGTGGIKNHEYVAPGNDSESGVMNRAIIPNADCWAELDFVITSTEGTWFELYLKSQYVPPAGVGWGTDGNNYIEGRIYLDGDSKYYSFRDTGVGTNAVTSSEAGAGLGAHTLRMEVVGTAAKLYLDGALKLSATAVAAVANPGYAGFLIRPWGAISVGEFRAGDFSTPYVPPPIFWQTLAGTSEIP